MSDGTQRTLKRKVSLGGTGVHSGEEATLSFLPAEPDTGIRFRRVDLEGAPEVPADLEHVVSTELGTTLGVGDEVRILTVEHVLAALAAQEIDNAVLELAGPETPIRDGSFADYVRILGEAGIRDQEVPARVVEVTGPLTASIEGGASYVAVPEGELKISATIDYPHPAIGRQYGAFSMSPDSFRKEISPARTFGFKADAEALWARGLARGSSLENSVILDESGVMNPELRFPDEFLRHKVGDILGDLKLLGARLKGHIVAERPSHKGNVALVEVLEDHARMGHEEPIVDVQQIMQYLPHRYPMLLVDRIIDFESGKRIVGIKNVTINEPFFQGHYPDHPIMPGVLIIEAMAQVGGLLLIDTIEDPDDKVVYFMSLDNVKWRRPVTPGDQIVFELEMLQHRRHVCKMRGIGTVEGQRVAEADLMARIIER